MKTEQILLALEIYESGSITKAAKKLFLSQPNAGNSLSALENEIGYKIFERTSTGSVLTLQGEEFLQYARSIRQAMERIYTVGTLGHPLQFSVTAYPYSFVSNSFARLSEAYIGVSHNLNFSLSNTYSLSEAMKSIEYNQADVAVAMCRDTMYPFYKRQFIERGLTVTHLADMPVNIIISANHPLAGKHDLAIHDLVGYPCITRASLKQISKYIIPEIDEPTHFIGSIISIDPGEARLQIVSRTESYIVSNYPVSQSLLEENDLICRKASEFTSVLFALTCEEKSTYSLTKEYLQLLKEELPADIVNGNK